MTCPDNKVKGVEMGEKIFLMYLIMIILLIASEGHCENSKILIIHITGVAGDYAVPGLRAEEFAKLQRIDKHIEALLDKQFGDTSIFQLTHMPPYKDETGLSDIETKVLDKIFPQHDKILIEVALRYYGNVYQWAKENSYPEEVLKLFENASTYVSKAVKHFRSSYPNSQVWGFSMHAGYNILMRAIEKDTNGFDYLHFVAPPIQNEEEFNALLLKHGYNYSTVVVIAAEGDETAPVELQGGGGGFKLIKKMRE